MSKIKEGLKTYKKMEVNPRNNNWYDSGVAVLSEDAVELLNEKSKVTGIKYEPISEAEFKKTVSKKEEPKKEASKPETKK